MASRYQQPTKNSTNLAIGTPLGKRERPLELLSAALFDLLPTVDNLRNLLLTATPEVITFLQQLQEGALICHSLHVASIERVSAYECSV